MSLAMTIMMLVAGWLVVAGAMLWGVMRIARRHHHPQQRSPEVIHTAAAEGREHQHATAH